ncbi:hypothetical protein BS78_03G039600 [Paspalum vaginatum]|nr:hypothetical protein BS78_03G039600 [Paspalum vaginatum]
MATTTRWQRYAQLLSSHPYHSAISSAPCFALGARDDDHGSFAPQQELHSPGAGALASPGTAAGAELLPRASDRFFVSPAPTASLVDDAAAGTGEAALRGAVLVETYSSDPRGRFLESMAEMAAACGAEGMPAPEYREFMDQLLSCYLERNDRRVHRHVLAAFDDLNARRWPNKRRRPLRGLMKMNPCVSGGWQ